MLWLLVGSGVLAAAYAAVRARTVGPERQAAALMCALVLAVPVAWTHYLVWTIPAFFLLAADVGGEPGPAGLAGLAGAYVLTAGGLVEAACRIGGVSGWSALAAGALATLAVGALGIRISRPPRRSLPLTARPPRTDAPEA